MSNDGDSSVPFPWSVQEIPMSIKELIGRPCRVIRPDTLVTEDYKPERVNIHLGEDSRILDIKFG